jgi:hypothetical protein
MPWFQSFLRAVFVQSSYRSFFPLALQPNSGLGSLHETFHFILVTRSRTVGRTTWTGDELVARPQPVHKHRKTHTQHKHETSMPRVEFEPTGPASARVKTIHALDLSATTITTHSTIATKYINTWTVLLI